MSKQYASNTDLSLQYSQILIRGSFVTTVILTTVVAWLDIQSSQAAWWLIMSIMLLPLLSFSHSVISLQVRGLIWFCFVLCLYFTMAVVAFITTTDALVHGLLALSTTLLFCSILFFVRQQTKARKSASTRSNQRN